MSSRRQNKSIKRRSHDQVDIAKDKKKHLNLSHCEVESKSSSCGSKKSHKKISKTKLTEGDNFFIVDKIVGQKICQGKTFFKVQWQGYDESEDSWEPEENLSNVMDLIEEFKTGKISDNKSEENNKSNCSSRSRNTGCYEYVPSNKVVATKTKYFDDIRDGKIDLTKSDLYSRVKTRKRLNLEENSDKRMDEPENLTEDLIEEQIEEMAEVIKPDEPPISFEKSKFYQSNLFEMTAEFIKNGSFKKSHNTIASKSSSNDDISLFNYSISPNTNQSDEFIVQISPAHHASGVVESSRQSVHTQTSCEDIIGADCQQVNQNDATPQSTISTNVKPHIQRIMDKIDQTFERSSTPQRLVTSESHLLTIYAKEIKQGNGEDLNLPTIQTESELISIDNFDDLKCSILMDKYNLLHDTLQAGATFNWGDKFMPEFMTPLQLAVSKNRVNIVRLLLRYGASPDHDSHIDGDGSDHPLIIASSLGYVHTVKALLDHGAFTDYRTKTGRTALFFAMENGRVDVASLLLRFGTNFYKIGDNLSGPSLVNDLLMCQSVSSAACVDMLALMRDQHTYFITALNRTVSHYLTRHLIKQTCTIMPHQWVSVLERDFHTDFLLDSSIMPNIHTPVLLLVHGVQADCDFHFWIDNDFCSIESVYVNGKRQSSLTSSCFITTMWPLTASTNTLTVHFIDKQLLSPDEQRIRVAIVAISIDCSGINTNKSLNNGNLLHQLVHSRHYH